MDATRPADAVRPLLPGEPDDAGTGALLRAASLVWDPPPSRRRTLVGLPLVWAGTFVASWLAYHEVVHGAILSHGHGTVLPHLWLVPVMWIISGPVLGFGPHHRPVGLITLVVAGQGVAFAVPGLVMGEPVRDVLWVTACQLVANTIIQATYRTFFSPHTWAPNTTRATAGLALVGPPVSCVCAFVGGYPGLEPFSPDLWEALAWWAWDGTWAYGVGIPLLLLGTWRGPDKTPRHRAGLIPVMALATALAFSTAYGDQWESRDWIALGIVALAGSMLSPRLTALYLLLCLPTTDYLFHWLGMDFVEGHDLGDSAWMHVLVIFLAFLGIHLSVLGEERRRMVEELDERRLAATVQAHTYSALFDAMNDGFVVADGKGRIWLKNPAAERLLGRDFDKAPDTTWGEHFGLRGLGGQPVGRVRDALRVLMSDGRVRVTVRTPGTADSPPRTLDVLALLVELERGNMVSFFLHDVTAETQQMEEMSRFAGTVAHDLRNPLSAVRSLLVLAQDALEQDPDRARQALRRADAGARALTRVIEGWLAHTVTRSGALSPRDVQVQRLAETVVASGVALPDDAEVHVDAPHWVRADPLLVRQLLANLIGNSVKYARPGQPPRIRITTAAARNGRVEVRVADRGVGVASVDPAWLLDEGTREPRHSDLTDGTGLGLAMCRRVAERHGGTLLIEGNGEGGATVRFTLPAGAPGSEG